MNKHDKAVDWIAALEPKEAEMVEVLQKHAYDMGFTAGMEKAVEVINSCDGCSPCGDHYNTEQIDA